MKLCIQTGDIVDRLGFEKGYSEIKKAGFAAVDWNLDHALKSSDLANGTYKGTCIFEKSLDEVISHYSEELSYIRKNELVVYQTHAPFPPYELGKDETLDYNIDIYNRMIEFMDYIGCCNLIIHGVKFLPNKDRSITAEMHRELNFRLYESLIPKLLSCKNPVKVCLENLVSWYKKEDGTIGFEQGVCADPTQAAQWVDLLNEKAGKDVFGFCFDVGHANLYGLKPSDYILTLGKRITAFHVHDNDGKRDEHIAPFTGTVDWTDFCNSLKQIGFDGTMDFETYAQHNKGLDFSDEMGILWLNTISKIGQIFIDKVKE